MVDSTILQNPFNNPRISALPWMTIGVVMLVLVALGGGGYLVYAMVSSSDESDAKDVIGNYTVNIQTEYVFVDSDVIYIDDEDTLEIFYTWEPVELSDGFEVSGMYFNWYLEETDESTDPNGPVQQASCTANPGDDELDEVLANFSHRNFIVEKVHHAACQLAGDTQYCVGSIEETFWDWKVMYNGSIDNNGTIHYTNFSKETLYEKLTPNGGHTGDYSMSIRVDAQVGGNSNCPHSDNGEEVSWELRVVSHKFTVESAP